MTDPEKDPHTQPDPEPEESEDSTRFRDMVSESGAHKEGEQAAESAPISGSYPTEDMVYLVRGKDRGEPAWHYVKIKRTKLPLFLKAVESGSLDVAEFGEVVASGWGDNPPDDVIEEMKRTYP